MQAKLCAQAQGLAHDRDSVGQVITNVIAATNESLSIARGDVPSTVHTRSSILRAPPPPPHEGNVLFPTSDWATKAQGA